MSDDTKLLPPPSASVEVAELVPQPHGGALRRGNPGNRGRSKSALARHILEASTPRAAQILKRMALKGETPAGEKLVLPDRIKALTAVLDRGGAPVRTELTGADGAAFVVAVRAATSDD